MSGTRGVIVASVFLHQSMNPWKQICPTNNVLTLGHGVYIAGHDVVVLVCVEGVVAVVQRYGDGGVSEYSQIK